MGFVKKSVIRTIVTMMLGVSLIGGMNTINVKASTVDNLYADCYNAVAAAKKSGSQTDINQGRIAQNALTNTDAAWAIGEFSKQLDEIQQPILVNICNKINKIQIEAQGDTYANTKIVQMDIDAAYDSIPSNLLSEWRSAYTSAIDTVQQQMMKDLVDAHNNWWNTRLDSDNIIENNIAASLDQAENKSIHLWVMRIKATKGLVK